MSLLTFEAVGERDHRAGGGVGVEAEDVRRGGREEGPKVGEPIGGRHQGHAEVRREHVRDARHGQRAVTRAHQQRAHLTSEHLRDEQAHAHARAALVHLSQHALTVNMHQLVDTWSGKAGRRN